MNDLEPCACGGQTIHAYQETSSERPRRHQALCEKCGFSWGVKQ